MRIWHRTWNPTWHIGLALAVLLVSACASGGPSGDCEPGQEGCVCEGPSCSVDGAVLDQEDAGPISNSDAGPERGFGEACSDKSECASNICILVGIGGVCSDFCSNDSCPEGYGCFGVFGAVEPGEVADVCVPTSTQLCSPCEMDSECALVGADLCLTNADARSFCARDCSQVACPEGYSCTSVEVEGASFQQCLPSSGACDCTAAESGAVEACTIATDFGSCAGTRSCAGADGWQTCLPPSQSDTPDGDFIDSNCDGIDGSLDGGIFVATNGSNSAACGLSYTSPCSTISFAIIRALQSSRGEVYVQAGDYNEIVVLVNGIDIYGGYDLNWQRDVHTDFQHRVTITGAQDNGSGGDGQYLTVRAHNLVVSTTIADLVIVGPDAVGSTAQGARSSSAIHIDGAIVDLQRVSIIAGNGANGQNGSAGQPGTSASAQAAANGSIGGNANEFTTSCNSTSHGDGGNGGVNACPAGRNPNGGNGGNGGEMDTDCDCLFGACVCGPCASTAGDAGGNAAHVLGTLGLGGGGGPSCGAPTPPGRDGRIQNGAGGNGANGNGSLTGGYWFANAGTAGGLGQHGGGGGGGGGSGGCDAGLDSYGAGGGGGGAGGCAATTAGGAGQGGGGSFGIFVTGASSLNASECTIQRGTGGTGGAGGTGGHGQRGGVGRAGGLADGDSKAGAAGGNGAHGGHAGGGGGGSGGISAGIYSLNSTIVQDCVISGGSAGNGGNGGASAPLAPAAERDGNDGSSGSNGALLGVGTCASANGC